MFPEKLLLKRIYTLWQRATYEWFSEIAVAKSYIRDLVQANIFKKEFDILAINIWLIQ